MIKDNKKKSEDGLLKNITEKQKAEQLLIERSNQLQTLMDYIPDQIYIKNKRSEFVLINKTAQKALGIKDQKDIIGKTDFDFFPRKYAEKTISREQELMKSGKPVLNRERLVYSHIKRKYLWLSTSKVPLKDANGTSIGLVGISRDITEKKIKEEKIEYLSFHDTLTGLYNRAFFGAEVKRLDTERQLPITIVMGDINGLKLVNDVYGHDRGDMLIKKISDILQKSFRKEDIVSRWGGDEFVTILPKTNEKYAKDVLKRIKLKCKEGSTHQIPLSISLGIAIKKVPSEDIKKVFKAAEDEMYKNKITESESAHEVLINSFKKNLQATNKRSKQFIDKIQEYAEEIGKRMNLSKLKLEELKLLLNLHNIGKLALADEIMSKPGRLSDDEWKIVKRLPELGYRIAGSSEQLKPISEAILSHHEWYNGSGYPRGIKGEDIPILSRISLLINAFEAMTKDRPYKKKLTYEQAIDEIKKCSGTQFDPEVVKIFLEVLKEEKKK